MDTYYRVFSMTEVQPTPEELLTELRAHGFDVNGEFHGEPPRWFLGELLFAGGGPGMNLECFSTRDDGIRSELNTWAAWVESVADHAVGRQLMVQLISALQVYTLHYDTDRAGAIPLEITCLVLCRFLAQKTGGVYQVDDLGIFAKDGTLLVAEVAA